MWRFRSRFIVPLLAGLVVAAAGAAFFLIRDDRPSATNREPTRFESWNPVTPSSSYRLVLRHLKPKAPVPPRQAAGGEISMLPPADALRTIVISVDANCEPSATMTLTDNATGIPWYETRTTRDTNVVEFFPRPGIFITDDNRFLELPTAPGYGLDAIECGGQYEGPAADWEARLSKFGASRTGSADYLGDKVSRYESTAPADAVVRGSLIQGSDGRPEDFQDVTDVRSVWLVHDGAGLVVSTSLFLVFRDGHEELFESEEILESTVFEAE